MLTHDKDKPEYFIYMDLFRNKADTNKIQTSKK